MYILIVVAMAASQNALAAVKWGGDCSGRWCDCCVDQSCSGAGYQSDRSVGGRVDEARESFGEVGEGRTMTELIGAVLGVLAKNSLITAFVFVGATVWSPYLTSARLTRGQLH
tara:strand:- start:87005 stop:87343 length:339 start_codon:yes stop_codon:yes gene_type:complete